ncbi:MULTISPECIES: DUF5665 domain-containing protein [unclassified Romboutsia]|uniref:DUF5665 domain-containing protein n=1 Tax=unclassified Romboutsia TaxID=2626894 RepID=UPI0008225B63|nr:MULTISPECIES: DUF5665 domain-containing protein [unclassified Romboutsia]SCH14261.1 Uncharacterised protein [uncultured Clostridium sp.]
MRHKKYETEKNHNEENPTYISMKKLDEIINEMYISDNPKEDLGLIKRYLERLMLIIERSRIREYMMLTDSKRRLFLINFIAGLGKGFGQAIGFSVLAALLFYLLASWIDLPIIGAYIAKLLNVVDNYRNK